MMVLIQCIVTLACIITASAKVKSKSEPCEVPDKAQLEAKLDKIFGELPEQYVVTHTAGDFLLKGAISLGNMTIRGLNYMVSDRPYKTFCRGEDKVTLFTLRSRSPLRVTIPWYVCSNHNGTVASYAGAVRYEGELITSKSGDGTSSKIRHLSTVMLEAFDLRFTGLGSSVSTAVNVIGHMFSGPIRLYWTEEVTRMVERALREALEAAESCDCLLV